MPTLLTSLNSADMKVRWQEPYVSEALNIALASRKRGVHFGFTPVPGGALVLDLEIDSDKGASLLVYRDSTDNLGVTVWKDATVSLDLAGAAGLTVYVGVAVDYTQGVATTGEINAYSQAEFDAGLGDVIVLCSVDVPAVTITADDIDTAVRDRAYKEPSEADRPALETQRGVPFVTIPGGTPGKGIFESSFTSTGDTEYSIEDGSGALSPPSGEDLAYKFTYNGPTAGNQFVAPRNLPVSGSCQGVIAAVPKDYFEFELQILTNNATCDSAGAVITFYDSALTIIATEVVGPTSLAGSTVTWTQFRGTVQAPAGAVAYAVGFGVDNISSGYVGIAAIRMAIRAADDYKTGGSVQSTDTALILNRFGFGVTKALVTAFPSDTVVESVIKGGSGSGTTWEIGDSTENINLELAGQYTYGSTVSRVVKRRMNFDLFDPTSASPIQLIGGTGTLGKTPFGSFNRVALGFGPGLSLITFRFGQIPIGASITRIAAGVDNPPDPGEDFGFILTYDNLETGEPTTGPGLSVSGLTRTGAGGMRLIEYIPPTPVLINPTAPECNTIYVTIANGVGAGAHEAYWLEIDYEIPSVEVGLFIP